MDHIVQPFYHPTEYPVHESLHQLLATKTFAHTSTTKWREQRMNSSLPIHRSKLSSLRQELITPSLSHSLHSHTGAYINLEPYFNDITTTYTSLNALYTSDVGVKSWLWKLSWDNRYLWGKNEAWNLSPLNVAHNQSPMHVHDIMIARIPERPTPFTNCVLESHIDKFFTDFDSRTILHQGEEIYQSLMLCSDWMAMCCELDCTLPNTPLLYKVVCFKCAATKELLRTTWLDDPFQWHDELLTIFDFPNAAFSTIPLSVRRYCWMHGVSNLISNSLINLHDLLPARSAQCSQFHHLISTICKHWHPTKVLIPKQMKEFFALHLHKQLHPLYSQTQLYHLSWPVEPHSFMHTTSNVVAMLLDNVRVYYEFAYTHTPTDDDYCSLLVARDCILAVHALFKWRLAPTTHYLTNHAITDAQTDDTAYNTLQEGVKHKNKYDIAERTVTMQGCYIAPTHETPFEHMLNQQHLRLAFTYLGYAPTTYTPTPVQAHPSQINQTVVTPPRFAPLTHSL